MSRWTSSSRTWGERLTEELRPAQALAFATARVLGLVVAILTSLVLVRAMPVAEFGAYSGAVGIVLFVTSLGYLGADQLFLAGQLDRPVFASLLVRVASIVFLLGLVSGLVWPNITPTERILVLLLTAVRCLEIGRGVWIFAPQLSRDHGTRARRELVTTLVLSAGALVGVVIRPTAASVAVVTLLVSACVSSIVWRRQRPQLAKAVMARLSDLRLGLGYAASSMLYTATSAVGLAMLPVISTTAEVAWFRAAMLVYMAVLVLPVAINNDALRPHLLRADSVRGTRLLGPLLVLNLALAAGVVCLLMLVYWVGVERIFGDDYAEVAPLLLPLAASVPLAFLSSYTANLLIVVGWLSAVVKAQGAVLACSLVVNAALISRADAKGAAISLLVVDALSAATYLALWGASRSRRKDGDRDAEVA